jgi:heme-degrading monooxygenase HmoA
MRAEETIGPADGRHRYSALDQIRPPPPQWRRTPKETAMIVTVFRSRVMPGFKDEYVALVDRMQQIARTIPGYISHKGFWAEDGERVTIVEFEHEEGQRAWRMHPEHLDAQRQGRVKYYETYDIQVCNVMYEAHFDRKTAAKAGS